MLRILIFLFATIPFTSLAQKDDLYFFCTPDSAVFGVRNAAGVVVIPARYHAFGYECGMKITSREIILWDTAGPYPHDSLFFSYGVKVFNRQGKFLYSPYWFDNMPDYYVEGLRRFVENGKMGMADRFGNKIIPAKYNMLDPPYRGYILACLNCRYALWTYIDEEHCCGYRGSEHVLLTRNGNIVKYIHDSDVWLNDSFLTTTVPPLVFTATEKKLIQNLSSLRPVREYLRTGKKHDSNAPPHPTVLERPSQHSPYYLIAFKDRGSLDKEYEFLISPDGKTIRHLLDDGEDEPLSKWWLMKR
ncbi:MAG: hypothetical protein V4649_01950 [Bacteroidota bacterium]